jgi:hypothetical protein
VGVVAALGAAWAFVPSLLATKFNVSVTLSSVDNNPTMLMGPTPKSDMGTWVIAVPVTALSVIVKVMVQSDCIVTL